MFLLTFHNTYPAEEKKDADTKKKATISNAQPTTTHRRGGPAPVTSFNACSHVAIMVQEFEGIILGLETLFFITDA